MPKKTAKKKWRTLGIALDEEMYQDFVALAKRIGLDPSPFGRTMIAERLASERRRESSPRR